LIYREIGRIGDANPDCAPPAFFEFLGEAYATVAIRRQAKRTGRQRSACRGSLRNELIGARAQDEPRTNTGSMGGS
jgi:hypothetical protein